MMTIPSRPAPPPPNPNQFRNNETSRYTPTTNWDDTPFESTNGSSFQFAQPNKKVPPPRPPPPKPTTIPPPILKKPGSQQSVNILSHLFGAKRSKTPPTKLGTPISIPRTAVSRTNSKLPPKLPPPPPSASSHASTPASSVYSSLAGTPSSDNLMQLIDFHSPPSSPTLTQKSNSDCISVDSFSSESNYSPNNGNMSQAESGFEDDFLADNGTKDPWESCDPFATMQPNAKPAIAQKPINISASSYYAYTTGLAKPNTDDPLCNGKTLVSHQPVFMPTIIRPNSAVASNSNGKNSPISHYEKLALKDAFSVAVPPPSSSTNLGKHNVMLLQSTSEEDTSPPSPPMPMCAPPPPPPEYFEESVITSSHEDGEESYGIALYDFEATQDEDLSFRANEKIYLLKQLDSDWLFGRNRRGCEGTFPASFLDIKIPLHEEGRFGSTTAAASTLPQHPKVKALYSFNAEVSGDLPLQENDLIEVIYVINDEWLFGRNGVREGQFPANFIEYIPRNLPQMP